MRLSSVPNFFSLSLFLLLMKCLCVYLPEAPIMRVWDIQGPKFISACRKEQSHPNQHIFFSLLKWKENLDSCVLTQELLEANIKCPMPLEGWKTSRNPFVSKHKNIPPKAHFLSRGFIKCRKESSVGYPLLQNHPSPYPNPSRRICWAVHHIPVLVTLLCPSRSKHEVFLKATAVRACTKQPELCLLPDNFYCISKFPSPSVQQPGFPPDNVSHIALSSCLDHPLTCLGCGDLSSSHK